MDISMDISIGQIHHWSTLPVYVDDLLRCWHVGNVDIANVALTNGALIGFFFFLSFSYVDIQMSNKKGDKTLSLWSREVKRIS